MKNYFKASLLVAIAFSFLTLTSCLFEDELDKFWDAYDDTLYEERQFPDSYLGTWEDGDSNAITVAADTTITFESIVYQLDGVYFSFDFQLQSNYRSHDADKTIRFYLRQPGSTDELEMATRPYLKEGPFDEQFITYTKQ